MPAKLLRTTKKQDFSESKYIQDLLSELLEKVEQDKVLEYRIPIADEERTMLNYFVDSVEHFALSYSAIKKEFTAFFNSIDQTTNKCKNLQRLSIDILNTVRKELESPWTLDDLPAAIRPSFHALFEAVKDKDLTSTQRKSLESLLSQATNIVCQPASAEEPVPQSTDAPTPLELPQQAPELYASRSDRAENAIEFLHRVWGPYLEAGVLYQFQLRKLDPQLMRAICNYCKDHPEEGKKPHEYIPRKQELGDEIARLVTYSDKKQIDRTRYIIESRKRGTL